MSISIDTAERTEDDLAWDAFVCQSIESTVYHLVRWRNIIHQTFAHEPCYLMAREDGAVRGVLPLFLMRSRFFGSYLVSIPFFDYGGVVADSEGAVDKLVSAATEIAREKGVKFLELRHLRGVQDPRFQTKTDKVSLVMPLDPDPDVIWKKVLQKNKRTKIKKAAKVLSVRFAEGEEDLKRCYKVFSRAMRDLGSPVYPWELFSNIQSEFGDQTKTLMAINGEDVVGAKMMLFFRDTVFWRFQYSIREFSDLASNELLYWSAIKYACENGYTSCDLGRSTRDSGSYHFKRQFGAHERELYYQYHTNHSNALPDIGTSNRKFRLAMALWKRLPLWLTEFLGPRIVRNIP